MIADCQTIRDNAVSYGMAQDRIVAFPWGVDLERFTPAEKRAGEDGTFTLLSTRGWEPIYGTDLIAQAFASAARKRPELRLIMLGNGSLAAGIQKIFSNAGVTDRVNCPGQVRQADLPHFYRMADIYVSASYSDGTSISLLEAMACARPVLVSDVPGNREWVTPGVNGWLVPTGEVQALEDAILQAYASRQKLSEMGIAAHELAQQRADWRKNFPNLMKAYQIAMQAKP
jgi:glycosyltransferase involved in cell wall biosynthesis